MITFDLRCGNGHVFEGWFKDNHAFEEQLCQGMISCPMCEDHQITKQLSSCGILSQKESKSPQSQADPQRLAKAFYQYLHRHFEDVGPDFAKVALKIHYGAEKKRNIKGTTTEEEEQTLKDEGVDFIKVPVARKRDETKIH